VEGIWWILHRFEARLTLWKCGFKLGSSMMAADTNLFIHAADPDSPNHARARAFFRDLESVGMEFVVCELVLVELYMQLRNGAIFVRPYSAREAAAYCRAMKTNPLWRCIDYDARVAGHLWKWAAETKGGFRQIIDARLAFTLRHHGVTHFATANVKDFKSFGFERVWNPLLP
jgi:toxin-antitoxin system PIN domain toxin